MWEMNFYLKKPPFAPVFGLFAAKCSTICRKTHCVLVLNAVQNATKRKTKSINMRRNGINKTFKNHETHGKKGQNGG